MVSEKPEEQNPENPDDHDGDLLYDNGFIYGMEPNTAQCTYCKRVIPLGQQAVVGENRAADHRDVCTEASPLPPD